MFFRKTVRKYNVVRDVPDARDFKVAHANYDAPEKLPDTVDLRSKPGLVPEVWDQKSESSCSAHGWPAVIEIQRRVQGLPPMMPSRNFFYYNERLEEGDINQDGGAQIRTGGKVGSKYGVPPESLWGYITAKLGLRPSQAAYDEALKHKVTMYSSIQSTPEAICAALAAGKAVVFGFTVYSSFEGPEVAKTGILKMPEPNERTLGGHCVCAVGYRITSRTNGIDGYFIIRNSWGAGWGQQGYFLMPFAYFRKDIASDPWVVSVVHG